MGGSGASGKTFSETISKAWKIAPTSISVDPSEWDAAMKLRMQYTLIVIGVAIFRAPISHALAVGVFAFGLVRLDQPAVLAISVALYGWRKGNKWALLVGGAYVYAYAFGVQVF